MNAVEVPPCPDWCTDGHADDDSDLVRDHTLGFMSPLADVDVFIYQSWLPGQGFGEPMLFVRAHPSTDVLRIRDAREARALADVIATTGRAAKLRDALRRSGNRFDEILADYVLQPTAAEAPR